MLALVACTSSSSKPTREVAEPVAPPAGSDFTVPDARIVQPRVTDIQKVTVAGDDRTVTITYTNGVKECFGLHHTEAAYDEEQVGLIVYVGNLPRDGFCNLPALSWRTVVKLRDPVGSRSIIDGSTGKIVWASSR